MSGRDPSNRSGEVPPDQLLALLDTTADAVVVVDEVGTIRYWNRGAEAMFSHDPHEALGQSLDLIIPEHLRDRHWEGFRTAMATGRSRYSGSDLLAVPAITADGRRISIEFTVTILPQHGVPAWVAAVIRDVTPRWAEDRRLRQRVAELEESAESNQERP